MERTLSDDDLAALNTAPIDALRDIIDEGKVETAVRFVEARIDAHRRCIDGLRSWTRQLADFLTELEDGYSSASLIRAAEDRSASLNGPSVTAPAKGLASSVRLSAARGDVDSAASAFTDSVDSLRQQHAVACDAVTILLSQMYDEFGVAVLEAGLRRVAEDNLLAWMATELARDLRTRTFSWASLLRGNFADIAVRETAEGIEFAQRPCGTCARQVNQGRYSADGFAVVAEHTPLTWGRSGEPVYRTHVALVHDVVPRERIGSSWPVFRCPRGLEPGECVVVLSRT